jgi:hypothetical protein
VTFLLGGGDDNVEEDDGNLVAFALVDSPDEWKVEE